MTLMETIPDFEEIEGKIPDAEVEEAYTSAWDIVGKPATSLDNLAFMQGAAIVSLAFSYYIDLHQGIINSAGEIIKPTTEKKP